MGPGWGKKRARQLRAFPFCQWEEDDILCNATAVIVDHVKPRFEGGTDDDDNLQSLCKYHSDLKTAAEGHRAWAQHKAKTKARFDRREKHPGEL